MMDILFDQNNLPTMPGHYDLHNGIIYQVADTFTAWYFGGLLHKLDKPAVEWKNGAKDWYYHGNYVKASSQEEFEQWLKYKSFL